MTVNGIKTNGGKLGAKKAAQEKYAIGHAILKPAVHHESFEQLWETKWKAPVSYDLISELPTFKVDINFAVHDGRLPVHVRYCEGF